MPSPYLHFKPSQFIGDVRKNEFRSDDYSTRQSMRLRAAKEAFMKLPEHEQVRLARIADALPGRNIRTYGTITAFEILARIAFNIADQENIVDTIFDKVDGSA